MTPVSVDVVFLRDDDGDVLAVFPGHAATMDYRDKCMCYSHIGQHGCASLDYCADCEEVTDPAEYKALADELGRIGYELYVIRKGRMTSDSYIANRMLELDSRNRPVLQNGAEVLLSHDVPDGWIVLAKWGEQFVTWCVDSDGHAFWGHYFGGLVAGVADFNERTGRNVGG